MYSLTYGVRQCGYVDKLCVVVDGLCGNVDGLLFMVNFLLFYFFIYLFIFQIFSIAIDMVLCSKQFVSFRNSEIAPNTDMGGKAIYCTIQLIYFR